jgi:hypothetical protein
MLPLQLQPHSELQPPTPMAPTPIPISEASAFLRGINCIPSDYNKFKNDTCWKQWHRHLKATANSHGITHILDPAYIPLTDSAKELFLVQQTFMYSVFEQCMHTNNFLSNRHSCIVSLNSACIPTNVAILCRHLNQQQIHKVSMLIYCRNTKRTYQNHLQQQILDLSATTMLR